MATFQSYHVISTVGDDSMSTLQLLRELSTDRLKEYVDNLQKSNRIMQMENKVLENFLRRCEPKLLNSSFKGILETKAIMPVGLGTSSDLATTTISKVSRVSVSSDSSRRRVNYTTKTDIAEREKDMMYKTIEKYKLLCVKRKYNLLAELEEIRTRRIETKETRACLENLVKTRGDQRTKKLQSDKFIRFLEEWLKSSELVIEKLRLQLVTLNNRYTYLKLQVKQKEELGESLHIVDLNHLAIENKVLIEQINKKNHELLALKKSNGEVNLELSKHKSALQDNMKQLNEINKKIKEKEQKIAYFLKEIEMVTLEVEDSKEKLKNMEYLTVNYTVPDLLEYVQSKYDVNELRRIIKIWSRRHHIQQSALETCIKTMKRLTGLRNVQSAWFKKQKDDDTIVNVKIDDDEEKESEITSFSVA